MKSTTIAWTVKVVAGLVLAVAIGALAQERIPERLSGLINDYTPSTVSGGPYEMRGKWSLRLHRESQTADFSAFMNMETSDFGISEGVVNPADPGTRNAHTHHITMTGTITDDTSVCPPFKTPVPAPVFVVTGQALATGNGQSKTPFAMNGQTSELTVCILGGDEVPFSNITLQFKTPASNHFGMQAIHGVVRHTSFGDDH